MIDNITKENFINKVRNYYQDIYFPRFSSSESSSLSRVENPVVKLLESLKEKDFEDLESLCKETIIVVAKAFRENKISRQEKFLNKIKTIYSKFKTY